MIYLVYKTTNIINGRIYIGVHCTDNELDGYIGSGKRLRRSIRCYGVENFKRDILHYASCDEEAYFLEELLVDQKFIDRKDTYNMILGGKGGNKGRPSPLKGRPRTPETKAKLSKLRMGKPAWNKGKPMSEEQRAKLSAARMGKPAWNKGKAMSEESKTKVSVSKKGSKAWNKGLKMK